MFGANKISNPFRTLRLKWAQKSSTEKWRFLYNIPKTLLNMLGVRAFDDMKVNWWSHMGNFTIAYIWLMTIYTLIYHYREKRFLVGCRCLCGLGIVVSVNR